jgi:phage-related protein (TIGR01555 family)
MKTTKPKKLSAVDQQAQTFASLLSPQQRADLKTHLDGWQNILTGIGLADRDKRKSASFSADSLSWEAAQELWRGNDMAAKIITKVPKEMLRRGYDVRLQDEDADNTKEAEEAIETKLDELEANARLFDALCYERAYGGGAVLLGARDGAANLREPLNEAALQSIDFLTALSAQELYVSAWYSNPLAPKYGTPARYRFQPQGIVDAKSLSLEIHESRLLIFPGVVVSRSQAQAQNGWGDSVLKRVNEALSDFGMTWAGVAHLLSDFAQAIYKIKGLSQLVATNKDDVVLKRLQLIDLMRSIVRGVILDSEEDFERKTTSLAGIPEVLDKFMLRLAAAAEMPVALLMGQAPAGLNATGASDIRFFYDDVSGEQTSKLKPRLMRLVRLLQRSKQGPTRGAEARKWSITFRPLWQMTEAEQEDLRYKVAQRDQIYLSTGVLSAEEVAVSRFGGDTWSPETTIDMEGRNRLHEAQEPEEKRPEPTETRTGESPEKADARTDAGRGGVMIALYPPEETALSLVVPGGEPARELHLTLCCLGKLEEFDASTLERLRGEAELLASAQSPLAGLLAGVGRFPASVSSEGLDVLWAAVDLPGLPALRDQLTRALEAAGISYSKEHGFTPHITLAYLSPEEESPLSRLGARPVSFSHLSLVMGDQRVDYPLGGAL